MALPSKTSMELVQRYSGAHVFREGQPCEITDVMVTGPGKCGHMAALCRLRNMMTGECTVDTCHHFYQFFTPEERVYRVTGHTDGLMMLHLEDDLGTVSVPVSESRVDQWLWEALHQGSPQPATVTLQVMKNPDPREGEQRVFYRLVSAHLKTDS